MRTIIMGLLLLGTMSGVAVAATARSLSKAGQPPQTWDHEPGPNDRLDAFQILFIDDHTCPDGQIKKFTAGSNRRGVRATRECVAR